MKIPVRRRSVFAVLAAAVLAHAAQGDGLRVATWNIAFYGDARADLAEPQGVFNAFDLFAFLTSFAGDVREGSSFERRGRQGHAEDAEGGNRIFFTKIAKDAKRGQGIYMLLTRSEL